MCNLIPRKILKVSFQGGSHRSVALCWWVLEVKVCSVCGLMGFVRDGRSISITAFMKPTKCIIPQRITLNKVFHGQKKRNVSVPETRNTSTKKP